MVILRYTTNGLTFRRVFHDELVEGEAAHPA